MLFDVCFAVSFPSSLILLSSCRKLIVSLTSFLLSASFGFSLLSFPSTSSAAFWGIPGGPFKEVRLLFGSLLCVYKISQFSLFFKTEYCINAQSLFCARCRFPFSRCQFLLTFLFGNAIIGVLGGFLPPSFARKTAPAGKAGAALYFCPRCSK